MWGSVLVLTNRSVKSQQEHGIYGNGIPLNERLAGISKVKKAMAKQ